MDIKNIGQEIRTLRATLKLTQVELAERSGVNRKTVIDIEAGELVRLESLLRVLHSVGMEISIEPIKRRRPTLEEVFEENAQEERDRQIAEDKKLEKPYKLADLIAEMPAEKMPMVDGWDSLKPVGREVW